MTMKTRKPKTPEGKHNELEALIARIFAIIDAHITLAVNDKIPLPFYDLNEMIKDETESNTSPLHLSIKFKPGTEYTDSECDIHGNHFGLLWMFKHRKQIMKRKQDTADATRMMALELYSLWQDDIMELEGIDVNDIETIDIYTVIAGTREIVPLKF
jgi:hypothetical protein